MKFYLGMNYNGGGIQVAKKLIPELEARTGHQCTSRWVWSEAHESAEFRLTIATTDLADIARANYVILAPLTGTARGCHVEMGLAPILRQPPIRPRLERPGDLIRRPAYRLQIPYAPEVCSL